MRRPDPDHIAILFSVALWAIPTAVILGIIWLLGGLS